MQVIAHKPFESDVHVGVAAIQMQWLLCPWGNGKLNLLVQLRDWASLRIRFDSLTIRFGDRIDRILFVRAYNIG